LTQFRFDVALINEQQPQQPVIFS